MSTSPTARPGASWGFAPWVPAAGGVAAAAGVLWALLTDAPRDRLVAVVLVIAGLLVLLVGLRWRERLTAGPAGISVRSLTGRRSIPWAEIRTVGTVPHRRLGTRSSLLEIDLVDGSLLAFGDTELGTSGDDVARVLNALRSPRQ